MTSMAGCQVGTNSYPTAVHTLTGQSILILFYQIWIYAVNTLLIYPFYTVATVNTFQPQFQLTVCHIITISIFLPAYYFS